jgi:hypothetical protein
VQVGFLDGGLLLRLTSRVTDRCSSAKLRCEQRFHIMHMNIMYCAWYGRNFDPASVRINPTGAL